MKKILTIVALFASIFAAQAQIGVMGGFTSSNTTVDRKDIMENAKNISLYHAGVFYKMNIGAGFAIQPSLCYQVKGATLQDNIEIGDLKVASENLETKTGFIELGAGVQWGIDLMAFRPYAFVEPFIGYGLTGTEKFDYTEYFAGSKLDSEKLNAAAENVKNKLEYGFGIGAGVEIASHVQVSVQWFKNLGNLYNEGKINGEEIMTTVKDNYKNVDNYSGIKVTLGILF